MKIRIALTTLSLALVSGGAAAQPGWYGVESYRVVPRHSVASIVRSAGLRPISPPYLAGHDYIVDAIDNYGTAKRVVIDAEFGDIIRIVTTARPRAPQRYYADRWAARDAWYDDDRAVGPPARMRNWRDPLDWRSGARLRDDYDVPRRYRRPPQGIPDVGDRRSRPTTPAARGNDPAHTASINPTERMQPPLPRARPVTPPPVKSRTPAESRPPAQASVPPPAATPAPRPVPPSEPRQAAPRVILPGGPTPKAESSTETVANSGAAEKPAEAAPKKVEPFPPVQVPDR